MNSARSNPPAYYVYEIPTYGLPAVAGDTAARLYWMRLASVLLLWLTVTRGVVAGR